MKNTLKQAIKMYGADMQLNIAIEEMAELTKEICKYKRGADNISQIAEEVADCYIMLEQIKFIFNLDSADISIIMTEKTERLKQRMKNASKCQQNEDVLFDIGDTAYCVNGYGSQRYIEEFTVAEIRITKDGIWLTDTKGMEWLARVCHFNRESAERELNSSNVALPVEVGDTVFLPYITDYETIEQYEVIEVGQDENGHFFRVNDEEGNKIHDYEIGTTVFLTHKEAVDKALQMIGGNKTGNFLYNRFMKTE